MDKKDDGYKSGLRLEVRHQFFRSLKSQAALEFLTTYAWAFLVILIMISALAYFGILSPGRLLPDRCNFGSELGCIDFKIAYNTATTGSVTLKLKNNVGEPIKISALNISSDATTALDCTESVPSGNTGTGAIEDISFTACNSDGVGWIAGEKTKVDITVTYYSVKSGSTYAHQVKGDIFTTVTAS